MAMIGSSVAALAVATIYYTYRDQVADQTSRDRTLRERVAYLMWMAVTHGR
jgi:hypothetical protein